MKFAVFKFLGKHCCVKNALIILFHLRIIDIEWFHIQIKYSAFFPKLFTKKCNYLQKYQKKGVLFAYFNTKISLIHQSGWYGDFLNLISEGFLFIVSSNAMTRAKQQQQQRKKNDISVKMFHKFGSMKIILITLMRFFHVIRFCFASRSPI